ncbi:hypothetical protein GCM10027419_23100 [Pandoraea terrae]
MTRLSCELGLSLAAIVAGASPAAADTDLTLLAAGPWQMPQPSQPPPISPPVLSPPAHGDNDATREPVRFTLYAVRDIEHIGVKFPDAKDEAVNEGIVNVQLDMREDASMRMREFSRHNMNRAMTLVIDGMDVATATIRSELGGQFELALPKEKARLLFQRVLAKAGPST